MERYNLLKEGEDSETKVGLFEDIRFWMKEYFNPIKRAISPDYIEPWIKFRDSYRINSYKSPQREDYEEKRYSRESKLNYGRV